MRKRSFVSMYGPEMTQVCTESQSPWYKNFSALSDVTITERKLNVGAQVKDCP